MNRPSRKKVVSKWYNKKFKRWHNRHSQAIDIINIVFTIILAIAAVKISCNGNDLSIANNKLAEYSADLGEKSNVFAERAINLAVNDSILQANDSIQATMMKNTNLLINKTDSQISVIIDLLEEAKKENQIQLEQRENQIRLVRNNVCLSFEQANESLRKSFEKIDLAMDNPSKSKDLNDHLCKSVQELRNVILANFANLTQLPNNSMSNYSKFILRVLNNLDYYLGNYSYSLGPTAGYTRNVRVAFSNLYTETIFDCDLLDMKPIDISKKMRKIEKAVQVIGPLVIQF